MYNYYRMKHDKLKQYAVLRTSLVSEKAELEARLAEIDLALGSSAPVAVKSAKVVASAPAPAKAAKAAKAAKRGPGRRPRNGASLKDAVVAALKSYKSLSRQDLLKAVIAGGYKFSAKDPLNSLSTLVYSNKKLFKANSGKISLS